MTEKSRVAPLRTTFRARLVVEEHVEQLGAVVDAGYDHAHQIGPNQEEFLEFYTEEVLPSF